MPYSSSVKSVQVDPREVLFDTQDVDHPEIGFDDLSVRWHRENNRELRLHPRLNPHEYREIGLMLSGAKSCAMIAKHRWNSDWEELCETHDWSYAWEKGANSYFVAVSEEVWRLQALVIVHRHVAAMGAGHDEHDAVIGRLLGYRQDDIEAFLRKRDKKGEARSIFF